MKTQNQSSEQAEIETKESIKNFIKSINFENEIRLDNVTSEPSDWEQQDTLEFTHLGYTISVETKSFFDVKTEYDSTSGDTSEVTMIGLDIQEAWVEDVNGEEVDFIKDEEVIDFIINPFELPEDRSYPVTITFDVLTNTDAKAKILSQQIIQILDENSKEACEPKLTSIFCREGQVDFRKVI